MESGYADITCSDLSIPSCYGAMRSLFPEAKFIELDILGGPTPDKYDAAICLSLIYLFDSTQLMQFLRNVSQSLRLGGHLILDSAGAPDNLVSFLIHDLLLRYENSGRRLALAALKGKRAAVVRKHHGYRRTDREIVSSAKLAGFELKSKEDFAFSTEWSRSTILNKLLRLSPIVARAFGWAGRTVPYVRMFDFKKAG